MQHWDLSSRDVQAHHPEILGSDDGAARVVALELPAGERMQEHETHEHTWLVLIRGELEITGDGHSVQATAGFVGRFGPQERREVRACSDARLLLLLAPWPGPGHPRHAA